MGMWRRNLNSKQRRRSNKPKTLDQIRSKPPRIDDKTQRVDASANGHKTEVPA